MKFKGTKNYVSTEDLSMAVNATIALERPLIIKGEPGTGKTLLAIEVAQSLNMELIEWHIKSTTKASQGLYEYDAVTRLRDSQLGDERVKDIKNYIKKGKLWDAFESDKQVVLLIDEIDKADIEFPNDLLQELGKDLASENIQLNILDANFPFIDGFPLLPHRSHNDGRKVDISLVYETSDGQYSHAVVSRSGYGVFESPKEAEIKQYEICFEKGNTYYDLAKYIKLGMVNEQLIFSEKREP